MSERKMRHWFSFESLGAMRRDIVSNGYGLAALLLVSAGLLIAAASSSVWPHGAPARLQVTWMVERGDYVYRLRGRYSIAGVADDFVTSVASDANPNAATSDVYVPSGSYRVTLEGGYTLERSAAPAADGAGEGPLGTSSEVVPASVLSANPAVVFATTGRVTRLGLSLVDMPGTVTEPEQTCMNGS